MYTRLPERRSESCTQESSDPRFRPEGVSGHISDALGDLWDYIISREAKRGSTSFETSVGKLSLTLF